MKSKGIIMKDIKKNLLIVVLSFIAINLSSCSVTPSKETESFAKPPLFWPLPPEPPKIKYIKSIERPDDLGIKKSFFAKLVKIFIGESVARIAKPYGITKVNDRLAVTDTAKRMVHVFDMKTGKYLEIPKDEEGKLSSPIGVAMDGEGRIYVADSQLQRVNIYNDDGKLINFIKGGFARPTGVAIDRNKGLLYVLDTLLHQVFIFDLKGVLKDQFGERGRDDGEFNFPTSIFVDKDGFIYITDSMNFRIQIFDKDHSFIGKFGRQGDGSGDFSNPKGVAVDSEGNIYVVDTLFDAVQIFDREGRLLLSFGRSGNDNGEFWLPSGIFIDDTDTIYVADSYNSRVQVFKFLGSE